MQRSASYHTKQRDAVISYLSSLEGAHATAGHIAAYFKGQGIRVGLTTVYRQLDKLVQEGAVKKFMVDGFSGACYQYIHDNSDTDGHYHLKCEMCGDLIHLQCDHVATLSQHFFEKHLFALKPQRTLFYGTCNRCYSQGGNTVT